MNVFNIVQRILLNKLTYYNNFNNNRDYSIWLFGEWFGKQCSDNVLTFANYVAKFGDPSLNLYWICDSAVDTSRLNKRIIVVQRSSPEAIKLQKIAGVAVMNQGYDDFCDLGENYLGNAITVNLWHGVMWKKIGFDMFPNNPLSKIYIQAMSNSKSYSLFCSPSDIYTKIFSDAFKLSSNSAILTGLPRNECLFDIDSISNSRYYIIHILLELGISISDKTKIITYMPTFRDNTSSSFSFANYNADSFNDYLLENDCVIIQKAHQKNIVNGIGYGNGIKQRIVNIDSVNPQILLAATDLLITDYSSCFFDYLLLDRPIIQFVYDYDYYSNKDRGLYYSWNEVDCGHVIFDEKELLQTIKYCLLNPDEDKEKRRAIREKFMTYESSLNSGIIYNRIIKEISNKQSVRKKRG